ncbi:PREDICTED: F-box/LRR-repeat protein 17 [Tarenaya hassleriana]|uniref:F-box/LRR-repeat protein 17 n=1 Tax=Tarenaya hassleriana TaxID=28532 RepID=UPI0008FD09A6|nr:PREDICTED: F-box/LRR-repeat protein 17 [Tarenaya hassleriana]
MIARKPISSPAAPSLLFSSLYFHLSLTAPSPSFTSITLSRGDAASAQAAVAAHFSLRRNAKKNRGSYNCGRCGLPKKGHVCQVAPDAPTTPIARDPLSCIAAASSSRSTIRSLPPPPPRQGYSHLRRALSFDDVEACDSPDESDLAAAMDPDLDLHLDTDTVQPGVPAMCLWEVLRRLPPSGLMMAARVCKGWRETTRRMWKAAEELRIRVPVRAQVGFIGSLLQKCPGLVKLSLTMESDLDATTLACIAFSCPNLETLEISMSGSAANRITGEELGRFVADKRCFTSLKMEGCSNLGGFVLCSSSLTALWLSDLHSLSRMVFNCPNLREISLEFSRQEDSTTDLVTIADGLGRTCSRLRNIHIASLKLSHAVVLALTDANLRELRMLSLVLGVEINDASVAAISSTYTNLELLDLSGSSITDSGIGMICNVFPDTLSKLLLALCPNITSSGIQFATAQLPLLKLMDCGMTISDSSSESPSSAENSPSPGKRFSNKQQYLVYQKMYIKHNQLKKLSLWGCSSLDVLFLNCPELEDLNLNLCNNLNPESLTLQCPKLESVHASGCEDILIRAIQNQVMESSAVAENRLSHKRLADGSKRVQAPQLLSQQKIETWKRRLRLLSVQAEEGDRGKRRRLEKPPCNVIVD